MRTHRRGVRKWMAMLVCVLALAGAPGGGGAGLGVGVAGAQELEIEHDARLEGYTDKMALDNGTNAMLWLGFGFLAAITLLGLFKDAKRSHGD